MRRRERERLGWERDASLADIYHDPRVEELGSSDDSDPQSGVGLNFSKKRFASDPLQFTGIDMAAKPRARRSYVYQDSGSGSSSDGDDDSEVSERQLALRDKEEALVQSALARIRRAHEKGKSEVRLDREELAALERRKQRMQARKDSGEGERRRKSNKVTVSLAPPNEIASSRRRPQIQQETAPPPGMLVAGPDGNLVYAPLGQYPPAALSNNSARTPSGGSSRGSPSSRPRSATNQSRNASSPLSYYPQPPNGRHISDPQTTTLSHPASSPHLRDPLPHEEGWTRINSASSRHSSISSATSSRHSQRTRPGGSPLADPFAYQVEDEIEEEDSPSIPGQFLESPTSSRQVPRDVIYSNVRRSLPGQSHSNTRLSPSSNTGSLPASISDPSLTSSRPRRTRQQPQYVETSSSSESSEDELPGNHGVKVFVEDEPSSSRTDSGSQRIRPKDMTASPARKPVGSGSVRTKKGRKGK